MNKEFKLI